MKKTKSVGLHRQDGFKIFLLAGAVIAVLLSVIVVNVSKISTNSEAALTPCSKYTYTNCPLPRCNRKVTRLNNAVISKTCVKSSATSTSTSASSGQQPRAGAKDDKKCRLYYPLNNQNPKPVYDASLDYCNYYNSKKCEGNYYSDGVTTKCGLLDPCCRNLAQKPYNSTNTNYYNISDGYCRQATFDSNSACVSSSSNCPSGKVNLNTTCMIKDGQKLAKGKCCGVVVNTPTPTPITLHTFNNDCGVSRIDCTSTFADGGKTTNNNLYPAVCSHENGKSEYKCFFKVPSNTTSCSKGQYASPVINSSGASILNCMIGVSGAAGAFDSSDSSYDLCSTNVISVSDSGSGVVANCKFKSNQ